MSQTIQIKSSTANAAPAVLTRGELAVELAATTRLWVGTGTANRLLLSSSNADAPICTTYYVERAGDTMSGPLVIQTAGTTNAHIRMNQTGTGNSYVYLDRVNTKEGAIVARTGGATRWQLTMANSTPESATDLIGSDWALARYNNAGAVVDWPLTCMRSTGIFNFKFSPTVPTAPVGDNTLKAASTAFVTRAVSSATAGVASWNTRTGAVVMTLADVTGVGGAPLNAPVFTGDARAVTPATADSDTSIATTAFVKAQGYATTAALGAYVRKVGDAMTGSIDMSGTAGIGVRYRAPATLVGGVPWGVNAMAFGWGGGGVRVRVDISDVGTLAFLSSPALVGVPTAPTAAPATNTTQLATTAFVKAQGYITGGPFLPLAGGTMTGLLTLSAAPTANLHAATKAYADTKAPLASPVFTGNPTAPTPATGDNDTSLATTAFVKAQGYITGGPFLPLTGGTLSGNLNGTTATFTGNLTSNTNLTARTATFPSAANSPTWQLTSNAGRHFNSHDADYAEAFDPVADSWGWWGPPAHSVSHMSLWAGGNLAATVKGWQPGGGSWAVLSDRRIKQDVRPYLRGLAEVLKIVPVIYRYIAATGYDPDVRYVGPIADDVLAVLPETVGKMKVGAAGSPLKGIPDGGELLTFDGSEVLWAVVNSIKELAERLTALEAVPRGR